MIWFYLVNKFQFQFLACLADGNHLCMLLFSTPVVTPDVSLMFAFMSYDIVSI